MLPRPPDPNPGLLFPPIRRRSPRYGWAAIRRQPLLLLAVVGSKAGMAAEDTLALCEIDSREFAVLDVLARADGPRAQVTIAHELRRDRTSAMRIARSLAGKGLVSLETDPRDGRAQTVAITRAGLQCLGLADDNLLAAAEDLLSILTERERTWVLTHVLRLL